MKTVKEIKEQIAEKEREFKQLDDINTFMGGIFIGWDDALKWVLEDNENENNI